METTLKEAFDNLSESEKSDLINNNSDYVKIKLIEHLNHSDIIYVLSFFDYFNQFINTHDPIDETFNYALTNDSEMIKLMYTDNEDFTLEDIPIDFDLIKKFYLNDGTYNFSEKEWLKLIKDLDYTISNKLEMAIFLYSFKYSNSIKYYKLNEQMQTIYDDYTHAEYDYLTDKKSGMFFNIRSTDYHIKYNDRHSLKDRYTIYTDYDLLNDTIKSGPFDLFIKLFYLNKDRNKHGAIYIDLSMQNKNCSDIFFYLIKYFDLEEKLNSNVKTLIKTLNLTESNKMCNIDIIKYVYKILYNFVYTLFSIKNGSLKDIITLFNGYRNDDDNEKYDVLSEIKKINNLVFLNFETCDLNFIKELKNTVYFNFAAVNIAAKYNKLDFIKYFVEKLKLKYLDLPGKENVGNNSDLYAEVEKNINYQGVYDKTSIGSAILNNNFEMIEYLFNHGALVNMENTSEGERLAYYIHRDDGDNYIQLTNVVAECFASVKILKYLLDTCKAEIDVEKMYNLFSNNIQRIKSKTELYKPRICHEYYDNFSNVTLFLIDRKYIDIKYPPEEFITLLFYDMYIFRKLWNHHLIRDYIINMIIIDNGKIPDDNKDIFMFLFKFLHEKFNYNISMKDMLLTRYDCFFYLYDFYGFDSKKLDENEEEIVADCIALFTFDSNTEEINTRLHSNHSKNRNIEKLEVLFQDNIKNIELFIRTYQHKFIINKYVNFYFESKYEVVKYLLDKYTYYFNVIDILNWFDTNFTQSLTENNYQHDLYVILIDTYKIDITKYKNLLFNQPININILKYLNLDDINKWFDNSFTNSIENHDNNIYHLNLVEQFEKYKPIIIKYNINLNKYKSILFKKVGNNSLINKIMK